MTYFSFLLGVTCPACDVLFFSARCYLPGASLLFFSTAKRKVAKESAALCPIAPRDKGIALRCYPSALLSGMALVFLPYRLPDDLAFIMAVAVCSYCRHDNHIYGEKRRHQGLGGGALIVVSLNLEMLRALQTPNRGIREYIRGREEIASAKGRNDGCTLFVDVE